MIYSFPEIEQQYQAIFSVEFVDDKNNLDKEVSQKVRKAALEAFARIFSPEAAEAEYQYKRIHNFRKKAVNAETPKEFVAYSTRGVLCGSQWAANQLSIYYGKSNLGKFYSALERQMRRTNGNLPSTAQRKAILKKIQESLGLPSLPRAPKLFSAEKNSQHIKRKEVIEDALPRNQETEIQKIEDMHQKTFGACDNELTKANQEAIYAALMNATALLYDPLESELQSSLIKHYLNLSNSAADQDDLISLQKAMLCGSQQAVNKLGEQCRSEDDNVQAVLYDLMIRQMRKYPSKQRNKMEKSQRIAGGGAVPIQLPKKPSIRQAQKEIQKAAPALPPAEALRPPLVPIMNYAVMPLLSPYSGPNQGLPISPAQFQNPDALSSPPPQRSLKQNKGQKRSAPNGDENQSPNNQPKKKGKTAVPVEDAILLLNLGVNQQHGAQILS